MSEKVKFPCNSCGRQFTWKPEIAGKRAKCKCGSVITVPKERPEPPEPAEMDEFDLAGEADSSPPPLKAPTTVASPLAATASPRTKPSLAPIAAAAAAHLATGGRDDGDNWKWWYYVVGGAAMVPVAFYQYFRLLDYEKGQGRLELKSFEMFLYGIFGKWGVCGFLIVIGAVCIAIGLHKWKKQKEAA